MDLNRLKTLAGLNEAKEEKLHGLYVGKKGSGKLGLQHSGTKAECHQEWKDTKHDYERGHVKKVVPIEHDKQEQIDEGVLVEVAPPDEEKFVKDAKGDFKKRYGKRWKEVLYATAWKKHNKEVKEGEEALSYADTLFEELEARFRFLLLAGIVNEEFKFDDEDEDEDEDSEKDSEKKDDKKDDKKSEKKSDDKEDEVKKEDKKDDKEDKSEDKEKKDDDKDSDDKKSKEDKSEEKKEDKSDKKSDEKKDDEEDEDLNESEETKVEKVHYAHPPANKFDLKAVKVNDDSIENKKELTGMKKNEETKVNVPKSVKSAIDKRIKELDDAMDQFGGGGPVETARDELLKFKTLLASGNLEDYQAAQVLYGTLWTEIQERLPAPMVSFLHTGKELETAKVQ